MSDNPKNIKGWDKKNHVQQYIEELDEEMSKPNFFERKKEEPKPVKEGFRRFILDISDDDLKLIRIFRLTPMMLMRQIIFQLKERKELAGKDFSCEHCNVHKEEYAYVYCDHFHHQFLSLEEMKQWCDSCPESSNEVTETPYDEFFETFGYHKFGKKKKK